MIYKFDDNERFTFKSIKSRFPGLDFRRFHEIVRIFIYIGFVKKSGLFYKRLKLNIEQIKLEDTKK